MPEKKPVDEECRSLLSRLADPAGPVWEGSVILRLTDLFDDHYYKLLTHGLHYHSVLSTSTVVRAIDILISTDYFDENQHSGALSLELHLRCVVAALRVLTIFGSYNCAPFLTFDLLENIFTSLSNWALYTCVYPGRTLQNQVDNLNNEFLIVHATDLVSSITSDRDLTIQAVSKVAAGVSLKVASFGTPKSLDPAAQQRLTPTRWYAQFREVENYLLNMRLFRESRKRMELHSLVKKAKDELNHFSQESEKYLLDVLKQLIEDDVKVSNTIAVDGFEKGTLPELANKAREDVIIENPPVARTGHFTYGLLDLVQHRTDRNDELMKLALYVAKASLHPFLQRKALEVLSMIGRTTGMTRIEIYLEQIAREELGRNFRRAIGIWREVKKQEEQMATLRAHFLPVTVDFPRSSVVLQPANEIASKMNSLVGSLEELLFCPTAPSKPKDVFQLLPCEHCQSRFSWSLEPGYCDVCAIQIEAVGPAWPAGRIRDVLNEIKSECKSLESYARDFSYEKPIQERISITRTNSESAVSHSTDVARLFKRPIFPRRGSDDSSGSERSLLRASLENPLVQGLTTRNHMKILGTSDSVYQTTAISPDCNTVVLVTPADFIVYDVSPLTEPTVLCWGETSGRHAPSPKPLSHLKNIDHPYRLAALTHDILAIASDESVDIRNAKTGERIKQLMIPGDVSRAISFSPNGQYLAIGLDNGDIIVYHAGLLFDFPAPPIRVPRSGKSPVTSIAFSHDSLIMAVCTKDNIVRVYRLENLSKGGFRKYVEPLSYGKRSNPDIADIAFICASHSFYIAAKNKLVPPLILKNVTSPGGNERVYLKVAKLAEYHRVACYPKPNLLAAALITRSGEFLIASSAMDGWALAYHSDLLDLKLDQDGGFCSVGFSEKRALALDRRGNLLVMELKLR